MRRILLASMLLAQIGLGQSTDGVYSQGIVAGWVTFGASLPGSCSIGRAFFLTSASAGQNYYLCTAANTWSVQGGSGGSMTWPTSAGVAVYAGSNTWGTSLTAASANTASALVQRDGSGNFSAGTITAATFATSGSTPGGDILTAGTGSINGGTLPTNSAGFAAPSTGGTSYLLKLPATMTAGLLTTATPGTGDGVNESVVTVTALPTGTLTGKIASGTAALGTSAIAAGTCATVVTVAATGAATSDVIQFTPNADISSVTGYALTATDGLRIYPYPTAGNVNFKVCNGNASASITPGAVTLNWRIDR